MKKGKTKQIEFKCPKCGCGTLRIVESGTMVSNITAITVCPGGDLEYSQETDWSLTRMDDYHFECADCHMMFGSLETACGYESEG